VLHSVGLNSIESGNRLDVRVLFVKKKNNQKNQQTTK